MLNATFLQQEAIREICRKFDMQADAEVKAIPIRDVRNRIGAHSPNKKVGSKAKAFAPIRGTLSGFKFSYMSSESRQGKVVMAGQTVDLKAQLEEHCQVIIEALDRAYEKLADVFWKKNKRKYNKHLEKLKNLRIQKDGGLIIGTGKNKIVIHGVEPS